MEVEPRSRSEPRTTPLVPRPKANPSFRASPGDHELSPEHRRIAGCIARYHRRAVPSPKHESYGKLSVEDQRKVKKLSAILRIADALDRGHRSKVQKLDVVTNAREVVVSAQGREDLSLEVWTAERKADYFEQMFGRKVRVRAELG